MIILVAVAAFAVTSLAGIWLVPFLRKIKFGQTINDIGPVWHKKKEGIPTMGGLLFAIGILAASVMGWTMLQLSPSSQNQDYQRQLDLLNNTKFFAGLLLALAMGFIGFIDDYIKVVKKRNLGLDEKQKLIMQILVSVLFLAAIYFSGDHSTALNIPFLGILDLGILYYPVAVFIIVGTANAVNLTDGIDGLCSSVTFVVALGLMLICTMLDFGEMNILATALAGGCLGFLMWNFHPAKVFMGDTGSMFLGGLVVAIAFGIGYPVILVLVGIVYFIETLTVIIQRVYFKLTGGKRLFKMTPIHHSFEMSGYSETKIAAIFSAAAAVGCLLAVASVRFL